MIIRHRTTVIQLYRAVYDKESKRSRTQYLGVVENDGAPTAQLLARLTERERELLDAHLAACARVREASQCARAFRDAPAQLRRIAAWLRRQPKSRDIETGAQKIRDAYKELYDVMRGLGISRLRGGPARGVRKAPVGVPGTQGAPSASAGGAGASQVSSVAIEGRAPSPPARDGDAPLQVAAPA